ncbi:MAG: hypothetical protein HY580_06075 [Nitrospinae bacterium]|nr:hypothetical protein [Nitrospinota bacterium]
MVKDPKDKPSAKPAKSKPRKTDKTRGKDPLDELSAGTRKALEERYSPEELKKYLSAMKKDK